VRIARPGGRETTRCAALIAVLDLCPSLGQGLDPDGDTDRDGAVGGAQAEADLEGKNRALVINM
jgi:hypothetical protein